MSMGAIGKNVDWGPEGIQSQSQTGKRIIIKKAQKHKDIMKNSPQVGLAVDISMDGRGKRRNFQMGAEQEKHP